MWASLNDTLVRGELAPLFCSDCMVVSVHGFERIVAISQQNFHRGAWAWLNIKRRDQKLFIIKTLTPLLWAGLTYTRVHKARSLQHFPLSVWVCSVKQEVLLQHKLKKPWLQYLCAAQIVDLSVQLILRCYPQLCSTIAQLDRRLPRVECLILETSCHLLRICPGPSTVLCLCMQQGRRFDLIGLASWLYAEWCVCMQLVNLMRGTLHLCSAINTMIIPHISLTADLSFPSPLHHLLLKVFSLLRLLKSPFQMRRQQQHLLLFRNNLWSTLEKRLHPVQTARFSLLSNSSRWVLSLQPLHPSQSPMKLIQALPTNTLTNLHKTQP